MKSGFSGYVKGPVTGLVKQAKFQYRRGMSVLAALGVSKQPVLGFVAIGLFWGSFAAAVPDIKAKIGVSDAEFGILLLINAVGLVAAMILAPRIGQVLQRRALQVSFVGMGLACPLLISMPTPVTFAMAVVVTGFASGLLDVLINTRVAELEAKTGTALMNANHAMFSVAYGVAALTMGMIRDTGQPPASAFWLWAVVIVGFTGFVKLPAPTTGAGGGAAPRVGFNATILVCGAIVFIAFMTEATVETWSALHIERTLHGNPAQGALGPAMLGLTMAVGRFSGAAISARFSDLRIIAVATCISFVGCIMAALAPVPLVAYVGFGILGLGISVIGPIGLGLVGKSASDDTRAGAIALASIIGFSGLFVAPALMGLLAQGFGLRVAYAAFAAGLLLLFPLIAWLRR